MSTTRPPRGPQAARVTVQKQRKRIAVIGSGVSGLVAARLLSIDHEVTLFESADRLGGHTHTVDIELEGRHVAVDTGFMVLNDRTYPNLTRMLELLGVPTQDSDMSFSVECTETGLEYQGSSLNGLFADRANLLRPSFYRLLRDILRFNRDVPRLAELETDDLLLGEYLDRSDLGESFVYRYLLPMLGSIWSAPLERVREFPVLFLGRFMRNHGLAQLKGRPQWKTIPSGARRYIDRLVEPLGEGVRLSTPIEQVRRTNDGVWVKPAAHEAERFDHAVLAVHGPDALRMLEQPTEREQSYLSAVSYQQNEAVLHTDLRHMPSRSPAWASWNCRVTDDPRQPVSVTYDVNRLQRHGLAAPLCVTLNPAGPIDPAKVLRELQFAHPVYSRGVLAAHEGIRKLNQSGSVSFCGAWCGYGFHEDGVKSALAVCNRFGRGIEDLKGTEAAQAPATGSHRGEAIGAS